MKLLPIAVSLLTIISTNIAVATTLGVATPTTTSSGSITNTTGQCPDVLLSRQQFSRIGTGMTYAQVVGILGCVGTSLPDTTDNLDNVISNYIWQGASRVITASFRLGFLNDKNITADVSIDNASSFDSTQNLLSIPALVLGSQTYTNVTIRLPASGQWQLLSLSDTSGKPLSVAPQDSAPATVTIQNYYGINAGTMFTTSDKHSWQAGAGCSFAAPTIVTTPTTTTTTAVTKPTTTTTAPTTPTIPAVPTVTIYQYNGDYFMQMQNNPTSCPLVMIR